MAKQAENAQNQIAMPTADIGEIEDRDFATDFEQHIRAGYQCMYISTSEESRVELEITRVAKKAGFAVVTWDCAEGFSIETLKNQEKWRMPPTALRALLDDNFVSNQQTIFVFRDLDDFMQDPSARRLLRTLVEANKLVNKRHKWPLVITSPKLAIHDKIKSCVTVLEFKLPNDDKLEKTFEFVKSAIESSKNPDRAKCSPELKDDIIACLRGLTSTEAENALSRCIVRHQGFKPEMLGTLKNEKAAIIKKSQVLTYIPEEGTASRSEIGGFDNLLAWLDRRKLAYTKPARAQQLDYPKGIVLIGIPGSGKSMVAKAIARLLGLPGYVMDVGAVFGHLVGESEQRMRDAIATIEAQQGAVLLLDEADKAFGGAADAQGDSGVTRRVFGTFLTWLAEKQDRTFVILTMNRTNGLPPEFLRAGRFDAVFYTAYPNAKERREIFNIHFRKRGVDPDGLGFGREEWSELVNKTNEYVGAEIEEIIREARYMAFAKRQSGTPEFEELLEATSGVTPLSMRDPGGMEAIMNFCKNGAKPVSTAERRTEATGRQSRSVNLDN